MNFKKIHEAANSGFQGKTTAKVSTSVLDAMIRTIARKGIVDSKDIAKIQDFKSANENQLTPVQRKALDDVMSALKEVPIDGAYLAFLWNRV